MCSEPAQTHQMSSFVASKRERAVDLFQLLSPWVMHQIAGRCWFVAFFLFPPKIILALPS